MVFKNYNLKLGNMKKPQNFTLYPYDGGDNIFLQSTGRIARVNIRTGEGIMNAKTVKYSTFAHLTFAPIVPVKLSDEVKTEIQGYLWHNSGEQREGGRGIVIENAPLFSATSKPISAEAVEILRPEWDAMKEFLGLPPDDNKPEAAQAPA